jgi:DNA-binding NarL/FixJ family response regulator
MLPPYILIADDHAVIRTGIKYLLAKYFNDVVAAEADACSVIKAKMLKGWFTHLILDLQLGDCNSIDIIPELLSTYPDLSVLVYTMSPEGIYGKRLLQMGVAGYLSKQAYEDTVVGALRLFLHGQSVVSDELKPKLQEDTHRTLHSNNPFDELSEREMTVFRHLLTGLRVKEISNRMELKVSTVATYKVRIFEKLGVNNAADMQRLADAFRIV